MEKVYVIFDSKYGNTKLIAENILKGINQVEDIETAINYIKDVKIQEVVNFDTIILGGPNHMGRPSRTIKNFVNKLAELDLKTKNVAVFGTYSGKIRPVDRAVKKLAKMVEEKLPNLKFISPSLSIRVKGIKGPVREAELPKSIEFGKNIADKLF